MGGKHPPKEICLAIFSSLFKKGVIVSELHLRDIDLFYSISSLKQKSIRCRFQKL
jgi:hypothetical protein